MIENTNSLWRYLILAVVLTVGFVYAAPNLFGFAPALQHTAQRLGEAPAAKLGGFGRCCRHGPSR